MPRNIDDFNRGCALILAQLYEGFPVPQMLSVESLVQIMIRCSRAEEIPYVP